MPPRLTGIALIAAIALLLIGGAARAQDIALAFGETARTTIDDDSPRASFIFEGLRGEVLSLTAAFTGDLEVSMVLIGAEGQTPIPLDTLDSAPGRDLALTNWLVPATDRYRLVVTRFGGSIGVSSGTAAVTVSRVGVSSQQGSTLRYGDTVYNQIDSTTPQVFYSFLAARGDVITVRMQRASGDLDATLQLVNSRSEVIAENDDSGGSTDAAIEGFTLTEGGAYALVASRYGGESGASRGAFVLTLTSASQTALGGTIDFALSLTADSPVRGGLDDGRSLVFYRFNGVVGQRISISMTRASGDLDPLVFIADASGRELTSDDDGGGGQNAAITDYTLPTTGAYIIGATRYERAAGITSGEYLLTVRVG